MADIKKTLWVEGNEGPVAFPIIGETLTTWKCPVTFGGTRVIKKNPYTHFENWDNCLDACKESAEARLQYAKKALDREQGYWQRLLEAKKPEGA